MATRVMVMGVVRIVAMKQGHVGLQVRYRVDASRIQICAHYPQQVLVVSCVISIVVSTTNLGPVTAITDSRQTIVNLDDCANGHVDRHRASRSVLARRAWIWK